MNIEDIQAFIRGREQMPILHVRDSNDPKYKGIEKFVSDINPDMEVYMHSVATKMESMKNMENAGPQVLHKYSAAKEV